MMRIGHGYDVHRLVRGRRLILGGVDIVAASQPRTPDIRLAGSYINFLIINCAIIAPSFDDPMDTVAKKILRDIFPDRDIVMVPGREILLGGGNIHCITQQQPK